MAAAAAVDTEPVHVVEAGAAAVDAASSVRVGAVLSEFEVVVVVAAAAEARQWVAEVSVASWVQSGLVVD